MKRRVLGSVLALALLACEPGGGSGDSHADVATAPPKSGSYEVTGFTIEKNSGTQRPISGHVVVVVEGATYTAHMELSTLFPGTDAAAAQVLGTGEGRVDGHRLLGTAHTQLVASNVPGVDAGFAFVPRMVSPKLVSTTSADFYADGSVRIEIENQAEEGSAEYSPTHTKLVGFLQKGK